MKKYLSLSAALLSFLPATLVFADDVTIYCGNLPGCTGTMGAPTPVTERITSALLLLLGLLPHYVEIFGFLFIMVGGAYILLSAGNTEYVTKGKNTITWAVIGIFIAQFAGTLVGFVQSEVLTRVITVPDLVDSIVQTLRGSILNLFQVALIGIAIFSGMRMVLAFGQESEFKKGEDGLFYAALGAIIINLVPKIVSAVTSL